MPRTIYSSGRGGGRKKAAGRSDLQQKTEGLTLRQGRGGQGGKDRAGREHPASHKNRRTGSVLLPLREKRAEKGRQARE